MEEDRHSSISNSISKLSDISAREQFPVALLEAGVRQLHPGDILDPTIAPRILVVGVPTWSLPDLQALENVIDLSRSRDAVLFVFDIDDCRDFDDVLYFMPGTALFRGTPVLAEYRNGKLTAFEQGSGALAWIGRF